MSDRVGPPLESLPTVALPVPRAPLLSPPAAELARLAASPAAGATLRPDGALKPYDVVISPATCGPEGVVILMDEELLPPLREPDCLVILLDEDPTSHAQSASGSRL